MVIIEVIHWLVVTIVRIFHPKLASIEPEHPQGERSKKMEEENQELKEQMQEIKELLKNMPLTVDNIEDK